MNNEEISISKIVDDYLNSNFNEKEKSLTRLMFGLDNYKMLSLNEICELTGKETKQNEIIEITMNVINKIRNGKCNILSANIKQIKSIINKYFDGIVEIKIDLNRIKENDYLTMCKELFAINFLCAVYHSKRLDYDAAINTFINIYNMNKNDKITVLKNMINDISTVNKYENCIFKLQHDKYCYSNKYFTINDNAIYCNEFSFDDYFYGSATDEEIKEANKIIQSSDFDDYFIDQLYSVIAKEHMSLEDDMVEYFEEIDDDESNLAEQADLLIEKLKNNDLFKEDIEIFTDALLGLKNDIVYMEDLEDDELRRTMYDSIYEEVDFDDLDDKDLIQWIDALSNIDDYIWKANQVE